MPPRPAFCHQNAARAQSSNRLAYRRSELIHRLALSLPVPFVLRDDVMQKSYAFTPPVFIRVNHVPNIVTRILTVVPILIPVHIRPGKVEPAWNVESRPVEPVRWRATDTVDIRRHFLPCAFDALLRFDSSGRYSGSRFRRQLESFSVDGDGVNFFEGIRSSERTIAEFGFEVEFSVCLADGLHRSRSVRAVSGTQLHLLMQRSQRS